MKNLILMTLLIVAFQACKKSDFIPSNKTEKENIFDLILKAGFDTTGIKSYNGEFIVEGDIILPKEFINSLKGNTIPRAVYRGNGNGGYGYLSIPSDQVKYITIRIDPNLPTVVFKATDVAITKFNNLKLSFRLSRVSSGGNIFIASRSLASDLAYARFPGYAGSQNPGDSIILNSNYYYNGYTNTNHLATIIQHELTHSLGLMHTNLLSSETGYAYRIPGTSNGVDFTSITYNLFDYNSGETRDFNSDDIHAFKYLFPFYDISVASPFSYASGNIYRNNSNINLTLAFNYSDPSIFDNTHIYIGRINEPDCKPTGTRYFQFTSNGSNGNVYFQGIVYSDGSIYISKESGELSNGYGSIFIYNASFSH